MISTMRNDSMKKPRLAFVGALIGVLMVSALAQQGAAHLLSADELEKVVPSEFFYRGQKAPTQVRNSVGLQLGSGKMTLAALVDASGYSTAIQQKYQGLLITESKLNIEGSELMSPGQYGFGFTASDKFVVMDVANDDVLSVPSKTDKALQRAVPLKLVEEGGAYRLYAGKKWVEIKME
jgi:hypothetical protein